MLLSELLAAAKAIKHDTSNKLGPPEEGLRSQNDFVVMRSLVRNTRNYIEAVANQANGAYENGWYDACAVMLRRLIETLIIEAFENNNLADKIKNSSGEFLYLKDLIGITLQEPSWNLGRNCKKALNNLKEIGDRSAHSRRFLAHKNDIEPLLKDVRDVVQELLSISKIK